MSNDKLEEYLKELERGMDDLSIYPTENIRRLIAIVRAQAEVIKRFRNPNFWRIDGSDSATAIYQALKTQKRVEELIRGE